MLNNGCIGLYFKDKTSILLSIIGITFFYIDRNGLQTQYTIYDFPKELTKKKICLDYFLASIKKTKIWVAKEIIENCELSHPLAYVKSIKIQSVVTMFVFNGSLIQFIFHDKSEMHINKETKQVVFFSCSRKKQSFKTLNDVLKLNSENEVKKRILYIKRKFQI